MTPVVQKRLAARLAIVAGLVATATTAFLLADSVRARGRLSDHTARVAALQAAARQDATRATDLHAQFTDQLEWSVARDRTRPRFGWLLLAALAGFILAAKWFVEVTQRSPVPPRLVLQLHQRSTVAVPPGPPARRERGEAAVDLSAVDEIVARLGGAAEAAIPILHALQTHYRFLPQTALRRVCERTAITPAQIAGVASFYPQFRSTPVGDHVVTVCHGTACHVAGAGRVSDELRRRLGLAEGQDTDLDRRFTVEAVPCLGCCTLAPVVQVDGRTHGHTQPSHVPGLLDGAVRDVGAAPGGAPSISTGQSIGEIRIGLGSCCVANGSAAVREAVLSAIRRARVSVRVKTVGCVGMCHQTPLIEVHPVNQVPRQYARVSPRQGAAIVRRHFGANRWWQRVRGAGRGRTPDSLPRAIELRDPPIAAFLGRQVHIATEHGGRLDPLDFEEYVAHAGFDAIARARGRTPQDVIALIERSGLRGRGGAGFPTGQKWAAVARADSRGRKYVICNGDEGDPGAFMDRMLLESYPYRIIEGLAIAAYAVGALEGFFYIRAEYALAVERISAALAGCTERGVLRGGDHGPGLRLRVFQGAGAFVCGEETALIASIEGQRGTPRLRPPYPAERGLWDRPTLVNNVETLAVVPWILRHGPDAFAALGTRASKGTKVFALTGKVRRGGLIEVPMGITIRQIVEDIGGGIREEQTAGRSRCRAFKAVQIGGPSGGCVPAERADTPVDYEDLASVGAIMGSGGLVVLDETDCMVDVARYFLSFTQEQSCGQCTPCRVGARRMLEILDRLCTGGGRAADLATLEQLGQSIAAGSLCGLGKTAPNPVLSTLRHFRAEYEAHVAGRCPAGKCKRLIRYEVIDACTGCTLCAQHCPVGAIPLRPYERHEIDATKCTRCDDCRVRCPEDAIRVV